MAMCNGKCEPHKLKGTYNGCEACADNWGRRRGDDDYGCFTYFITGRVGHCIMLPVWRAIGQFLGII